MNTKNNKRRRASKESIERVFIELLQTKEVSQITVSDICKMTELNRSTFYANYMDIYDLADKIREKLEQEVNELYEDDMFNKIGTDYLKLFYHIRDNQLFYNTYFKLGYDGNSIDLGLLTQENRIFPEEHMSYHIEFHKAGLNAIIKKWLASGCKESPEEIEKIIKDEYTNRHANSIMR